jgi:hypothetical protein
LKIAVQRLAPEFRRVDPKMPKFAPQRPHDIMRLLSLAPTHVAVAAQVAISAPRERNLPVMQTTKFEFVINLKTAKAQRDRRYCGH